MPGAQVKRPSSRIVKILCLGLYVPLAAAFLQLEMVQPLPTPGDPRGGDLLAYYYPMLKYGFSQLRSGQLPLWNPYQSCGTPFLAVPNIGLLYPLYLPYLFLKPETALNLDVVLHLVIASAGMFLLCRHFNLGRGPSWVAGIVYAYSGSMLLKVYFPNFLAPVAWIPLIFLLVDRTLWQRDWWPCAALAAVVGATLLGANVQFSYFTTLALIPFALARSAAVARKRGFQALGRAYGGLMLAAVLAVLIASVRVLPATEYMAETWRPPGSLSVQAASIMSVRVRAFAANLLTPGPPPPSRSVWSGVDVGRGAYVGVAPMVLALIGLLRWRERSVSLSLAAAGIAAALYSFGTGSPFYALMFKLPGGNWFRGLDRALIIFAFSSALLSGAGLEALLRSSEGVPPGSRAAPARGLRAAVLSTTLAVLLGAGLLVFLLGLVVGGERGTALRAFYCGAAVAILAWVCLYGARMLVRAAGVSAVALLIVFDLFHAHNYPGVLPSQLGHYLSQYDQLFERIRSKQGFDRTYIWRSMDRSAPLAKAGLMHGIWMITDYEPLSGQRIERYLAFPQELDTSVPLGLDGYRWVTLSRANIRLVELMGVRFFLVPDRLMRMTTDGSIDLPHRWHRIMYEDGISLYEYSGALPRAFVVARTEEQTNERRLLERLSEIDARELALVEEAIPESAAWDANGADTRQAVITDYAPNDVQIDVQTPGGGLLVLTDRYFPGWHAYVDGSPARIYRTDYLFRGVPVGAGSHHVEFRYRPWTFELGGGMTLLGLVVLAWLVAARQRGTAEADASVRTGIDGDVC